MPGWAAFLLRPGNLAILLLMSMAGIYLRLKMPTIVDDAFITYRYAQNLAAGRGMIFNPHERILGTTSPIYAVIMSVVIELGGRPWVASLALDCVLFPVLGAIILGFGRLCGRPQVAYLSLLLLFHDIQSVLPVAGLETGVFIALVYGALLASAGLRHHLAALLAMLGTLTRPEGLLALGIVMVPAVWDFRARRMRPEWRQALFIGVAPLGVAVLLSYAFYGDWLPQTIRAKQAQTDLQRVWLPFSRFVVDKQLLTYGNLNLWGVLEWFGFAVMLMRIPALRPVALWFVSYLLFMHFGRAPLYTWYFTPIHAARMMAIATGAVVIAEAAACLTLRIPGARWFSAAGLRAMRFAMALLLLIVIAPGHVEASMELFMRHLWRSPAVLECKGYERTGPWLRTHAGPYDEVATPEVGYIGYFSRRRIFDPVGLVSPLNERQMRKRSFWDRVWRRKSSHVVYPFDINGFAALPAHFAGTYQPVRAWRNDRFLTVAFDRRTTATQQFVGTVYSEYPGLMPKWRTLDYLIPGSPGFEPGTAIWLFGNANSVRHLEFSLTPDTDREATITLQTAIDENDRMTTAAAAARYEGGRFVFDNPTTAPIVEITVGLRERPAMRRYLRVGRADPATSPAAQMK